MKRIYSILVVAILLLIIYLFTQNSNITTTSSDQSEQYIVLANDINLREGPGLTYPIASSAYEGQALSMIEQQGDWLYVSKDEEIVGWIPAWHTSSNEQDESSSIKVAISTVNGLNVRAQPKTSSAVLKQLSLGNETIVVKEEDNWVKIEDSLGTSGWVSKDYINIEQTSNDKLLETGSSSEVDLFFTIKVESVNVRAEPNSSSAIVDTLNKEDTFKILDQKNNWYKIQLTEDEFAWVYRFYGIVDTLAPSSNESKTITIIYGGTNLRESPSTVSPVVKRANIGETYEILSIEEDWYQVAISSNETAFVAQWVVSSDITQDEITSKEKPVINRKKGTLNGVTIVLDPGHGGNDQGTAGYRGSIEKDITLITAQLLQQKLQNAGATVYLTRESDMYVDLRKRVSIAHTYAADAFISLHYDATDDSTISGFTTYYYHDYQQKLAQSVNDSIAKKVTLRDRGAQIGDYLVLRENYQNAILIELGYLSNPTEERVITTDFYREQATLGIYEGIINYFDAQLQ